MCRVPPHPLPLLYFPSLFPLLYFPNPACKNTQLLIACIFHLSSPPCSVLKTKKCLEIIYHCAKMITSSFVVHLFTNPSSTSPRPSAFPRLRFLKPKIQQRYINVLKYIPLPSISRRKKNPLALAVFSLYLKM